MATKYSCAIILTSLIIIVVVGSSDGLNIMMFAGNIQSHHIYFGTLGIKLAGLGHRVELFIASNAEKPTIVGGKGGKKAVNNNNNFTITRYPVTDKEPYVNSAAAAQHLVNMILTDSLMERLDIQSRFYSEAALSFQRDCRTFLSDRDLVDRILSSNFDFIIWDPMTRECQSFFAERLRSVPFGIFTIPVLTWLYRVPRLNSFTPVSGLAATDEMDFGQRLGSFVRDFLLVIAVDTYRNWRNWLENGTKPTIFNVLESTSFWFFLEDLSVNFPGANMPNTMSIGDVMIDREVPELPASLREFIDGKGGKNGGDSPIILISFGSYFDSLPAFIAEKFCATFKKMAAFDYRVIWKLKNASLCQEVGENIRILPWIPQYSLLAEKKVKLFVTHGGFNSLIEAVERAKPVIVFPFVLDQHTNAKVVQEKGYGIAMSFKQFQPDELAKNVELVMNQPSFLRMAERYSAILGDRIQSAELRVSHKIEHLVKYGSDHLRTGAFKLNHFQFLMIDLFLVLFLLAFVCLGISAMLALKMGRVCREMGRVCWEMRRVCWEMVIGRWRGNGWKSGGEIMKVD